MRQRIMPLILLACLLLSAGVHAVTDSTAVSAVELVAAGDIFPSPSLLDGGIGPGGARDYTPYYRYIRPYIEPADIATAWFGGPVAGPGQAFTGYPDYNNPPEFALAPKEAGFDILLHTNHALDGDVAGAARTVAFFRQHGLHYLGVYDSEAASRETLLIEKNGIKIAFLSFLYGLNGRKAPNSWMFNLMDPVRIKADIEKARRAGADFIIVAMHWGIEYMRTPSAEQKSLAVKIASYGADLILGSHPHVIQPASVIETKTTAGPVRRTFVIYSCGNFLCSQRKRYTDCGLIMRYRLEKDNTTGITRLARTLYIPTWVKWRYDEKKKNYTIFTMAIREAMRAYERKEADYINAEDYALMKLAWQDTIAHLDNAAIGFMHEE